MFTVLIDVVVEDVVGVHVAGEDTRLRGGTRDEEFDGEDDCVRA